MRPPGTLAHEGAGPQTLGTRPTSGPVQDRRASGAGAAAGVEDDGHRLLATSARLPRSGLADPWVRRAPEDLADHLDRLGPRPAGTPVLIEAVDRAGLTGRGGAHAPTAARWRTALRGTGPLTVVANAAESEPLSAKDGTLVRQRPHLVLDGLALAAEALGASRSVVWLHAGDDGARTALEAAVAERGDDLEIVVGPDHYLAGAASAIARAVHGGPALPSGRRPAVPGAPRTLVHNVETLARVALVARGVRPAATVLLSVLTPGDRQVVEVPTGTVLADVLRGAALAAGVGAGASGGAWPDDGPDAVLLGGFGGVWASMAAVGHVAVGDLPTADLGAGVVAPLVPGACGLTEAARLAGYLASMSARQCGPCLFGLPSLADDLGRLADGTAEPTVLRRIADDLHAVAGRGACHHPDGAVRMVASALSTFASDVVAHSSGRPCGRGHDLPVPGTGR